MARYKTIFERNYKTATGQQRKVTVREDIHLGGYEVIKWVIPKRKNALVYGTYAGDFTNKAKALKKARALASK